MKCRLLPAAEGLRAPERITRAKLGVALGAGESLTLWLCNKSNLLIVQFPTFELRPERSS